MLGDLDDAGRVEAVDLLDREIARPSSARAPAVVAAVEVICCDRGRAVEVAGQRGAAERETGADACRRDQARRRG